MPLLAREKGQEITGIERLHKLIADIDVSADLELWYILRGGTEDDWDCEEHDDKTLKSTLAAIADQIEREQGAHVSRMRVLAVVTDMERHVSGVEGMEDSPVARWARELREALGGEKCDPADFLPADERDAIAWVREHGGLDHVKSEWRSRVPYDRYERRRQRLLGHIAECETALGRRNERIEELEGRVNDLMIENTELRKRPAPKVLDADGVEIRRGDRVWSTKLDEPHEWIVIDPHEDRGDSQTVLVSIGDRTGHARPSDLTHRAPVLAADGKPLLKYKTVYEIKTGERYFVTNVFGGMTEPDFPEHTVECRKYEDVVTHMFRPSQLTHQRPDSWERIEEDAGLKPLGYVDRVLGWDMSKSHSQNQARSAMTHDLVRRAKALAERERGL